MKSFVIILAALGLAAPSAHGSTAEPPAGSWTITPAFVSQYMFRGTRLSGPALQPTLEYARGDWAAGVWGSLPFKAQGSGQPDMEVDLYAYGRFAASPTLSVVPGLTIYTYPGAQTSRGYYQVTIEPSLAVTGMIGPVSLTPKLYYDFVLQGPTAELTAACAVPLPSLGTELDFTATVGTFRWNDAAARTAPPIRNWGDYWLIGATVPYQFTPRSRITVGWAYTAGTGNYLKPGTAAKVANPAALGRGVLTVSYTCAF